MNIKHSLLLGLGLAVALALSSCGRMASSDAASDFSEGTVNAGADVNTGVLSDDPGNAYVPGSQGMRDANGVCINDTDGDNLCNEEDPDIDNDGIDNELDTDKDGDNVLDIFDPDIDDDGIANIDDNDPDGDGLAACADPDDDGDGIPDMEDADRDGDGILNVNDNDADGDGIPNAIDPDIDEDCIDNATDTDDDGDNIPDTVDPDANGDGTPDKDTTGSAKLVYFSKSGSIAMAISQGFATGSGTQSLDLEDLRKEAADNKANAATITPYDVLITVDSASIAALASLGNPEYEVNVAYTDPISGETHIVASSPSKSVQYVNDLVTGVSFANDNLKPTNYYASFQLLFGNTSYTSCIMTVQLVLKTGAAANADIVLNYVIKANAKAAL